MNQTNQKESYSDKEIVAGVINNDRHMIEYLFCQKCSKLLSYIAYSIFDKRVEKQELVNELFLYIAQNDWYKLRQFDFRSSLMTWMSVVAIRFFQKKRNDLYEKESEEEQLLKVIIVHQPFFAKDRQLDVRDAIAKMKNQRYKEALIALDFNDIPPAEYAKRLGITVDNLYNIHHRALVQLKTILTEKEDYYD